MENSGDTVAKVKIFDQIYAVRGEASDHLERLAQYVDDKMRKISDEIRVVDTQKVAVLAALNIADDYYRLQAEFADLVRCVEEKNRQLQSKLDQVMAEPIARQQTK
ncbi:MAG: cell division protein ZapA [Acidobacteria bacterium]|nr:cell division protein ZapA [Acidobacteriota bacterium]MBI3656531.1 cell division protein ZapA [Acidobacteriota bacterium]